MAVQLDFGLIVTDPQAHRAQLASKTRRCLSCSSMFPSFGAGNRICSTCKSREAWTSPNEFSISAAAF
ncbi:hypothetical protein IGS68_35150 (plasmid) [Skermanella sp. TT6]|uniref:Uncharacterized protein n=1 Tax=Skermanella cutis TaxID=2775420 RepID=A0ABX7BI31_9PROT|nr:hypothetical protein [Skermanella sp. TT6]QQP94050.1 hypothetical protein IGS68_35150 [Skermanella sp. TT6]